MMSGAVSSFGEQARYYLELHEYDVERAIQQRRDDLDWEERRGREADADAREWVVDAEEVRRLRSGWRNCREAGGASRDRRTPSFAEALLGFRPGTVQNMSSSGEPQPALAD